MNAEIVIGCAKGGGKSHVYFKKFPMKPICSRELNPITGKGYPDYSEMFFEVTCPECAVILKALGYSPSKPISSKNESKS